VGRNQAQQPQNDRSGNRNLAPDIRESLKRSACARCILCLAARTNRRHLLESVATGIPVASEFAHAHVPLRALDQSGRVNVLALSKTKKRAHALRFKLSRMSGREISICQIDRFAVAELDCAHVRALPFHAHSSSRRGYYCGAAIVAESFALSGGDPKLSCASGVRSSRTQSAIARPDASKHAASDGNAIALLEENHCL